jgi:ectoine hydroxylase-related dioxygenase (phytanoyl-CoA dioxygenase family)
MDETQRDDWGRRGFVRIPQFADAAAIAGMRDAVREIIREADDGRSIAPAYIMEEKKVLEREGDGIASLPPEDRVSKVFRVHRQIPVFHAFARNPALLALVASLLGRDLDCFLSQYIFKLPGALGQPWHQDSFYFPFDRGPQVGIWLALTDATLDNGPLWVLPGSHTERVHDVVADRREHANYAYVEIVDHDTSDAIPVLMDAGDLLVFHSHLFHKSTDNTSSRSREAMVYHYAAAGTVDQSKERFGFVPPNVDWMPVYRDGATVGD